MKNYYQTLGVSPSANFEEIKAAYQKFSKQVHPDRIWGEKIFEDILKHVNEAYLVLSDEVKRSEYDSRYNHFFFSTTHSEPAKPIQHEYKAEPYALYKGLKRKFAANRVVCMMLLLVFLGVYTMELNHSNSRPSAKAKVAYRALPGKELAKTEIEFLP